jgi:hypothetical protein
MAATAALQCLHRSNRLEQPCAHVGAILHSWPHFYAAAGCVLADGFCHAHTIRKRMRRAGPVRYL